MIPSCPLRHLLLLFPHGNVTQKIPLSGVDPLSSRWGPPLVRSWPTDAFLAGHRTITPALALTGGIALTVLLVGYVFRLDSLNHRLARSEAIFREFAESTKDVLWMSDPGPRQDFYVSPAYEHVWGRPVSSFYADSRSRLDAVHPDDAGRARAAAAQQRAGETTQEEYRVIRPDGSERWIWDRAYPVLGRDGEVQRVVGVAEDVTERKRAEAERRHLDARMQQTQKLHGLGLLAGGIAHDFNNLLTVIVGHARLALAKTPPDSAGRTHVARIETAGIRATELTEQMLTYSGRSQFVPKRLSLNSLLKEMERLLETTVTHRAVTSYELAGQLPLMTGDPSQIRQLVLNLITNAVEAVESPAGQIQIRTGVIQATRALLAATYLHDELPEGPYVYVEVADTGCGMEAETLQHLFDPFFTTKFAGRGLGLAAALGIVRGHDGAIHVDSTPGQGTTIRVLFPVSTASVATSRATDRPTVDAPWRDTTVLVVDDDPDVREVSIGFLESLGATALVARDGNEAVTLFRRHSADIDAVLLDLTMPVMDGAETFLRLREIRPSVPILLCSGYLEHDLERRYANQGFSGFLQKPFSARQLSAKLTAVLRPSVNA